MATDWARSGGASGHTPEPGQQTRQPGAGGAADRQQRTEQRQPTESRVHGAPMREARGMWAPEVEVSEEGDRLRVCVDLPGVARDEVQVDIREGMLAIHGERRVERANAGQAVRRSERRYGSFCRTIALPRDIDTEHAEARLRDGVLEITLPISQARQARRLEIE